jgi:cellulose synthase/poly-beta-1,6-N-acetylglucosamine synthase-like glycosyltransferase
VTGYQPSASVIVPAYNAEQTIYDCVRSLLALRYPSPVQVMLVDNHSRDATAEILGGYQGRVVVLRERTRGAAAARNAALARAGGEVVAFTDADCVVDPDWLAHLVAPLGDPRVGIAGGTILARRPANDVERFGERIHDHRSAIEVFRPPYAITMSWASRRAVLSELGGFDERFRRCQDADLSYRVSQAGYQLRFVAEAVVHHRNEDSLPGLFREGFLHGFHGVRALKRHHEYVSGLGHRRVSLRGYAHIAARLREWAGGSDPVVARCDAVFNSGKQAGKLCGSLRFGHLQL